MIYFFMKSKPFSEVQLQPASTAGESPVHTRNGITFISHHRHRLFIVLSWPPMEIACVCVIVLRVPTAHKGFRACASPCDLKDSHSRRHYCCSPSLSKHITFSIFCFCGSVVGPGKRSVQLSLKEEYEHLC